jgi:hypothetical protein
MLTTNDIITRLHQKMGDKLYDDLIILIDKEFSDLKMGESNATNSLNELYHKYVYPQIRQYGFKTHVKSRKIVYELGKELLLFKYTSDIGKQIQEEIKESNDNFEELEYEERFNMVIKYGTEKGFLIEKTHLSVWVGNNIYHWGPGEKWKMYGDSEINREITNDWIISKDFEGVYFTLYTHEELQTFCDNWKKNKFNDVADSFKFVKALVGYMGLEEFAS